MTVLAARLSFFYPLLFWLQISVFTMSLLAFVPESVNAERDQQEFGHLSLSERWQGDYDGMAERRLVRVLLVADKIGFFIDKGHYRGLNAEMLEAFRHYINRDQTKKALQIEVILLPVQRDQLIPALLDGKGDIAVGYSSIRADQIEEIEFSKPFLTNVKQIVVTNTNSPRINSIEDLSDQELHLRKSSSYYQHALRLNQTMKDKGLKPIRIVETDEIFEDSDLLQLTDDGIIRMTVVDDHIAQFWGKIHQNIRLYPDIALSEDGYIGWAFRKNSPKLAEVINSFLKTTQKGTELGNVVFNRYLHENRWVNNTHPTKSVTQYQSIVDLLKKYAGQYEFDYLMTKALAFQESRLNQNKRSPCGAMGVMQLLPRTAADKNIGIPNVEILEQNIHAGHKYLRFIQDRYFNEPGIDYLNKHLLTFAAYNAGPRKIISLRNEARSRGLDPNVWFRNVEEVAAEKIGRETVQYVSNIYKNYIAYKLSFEKADSVREKYVKLTNNNPNFSAFPRPQKGK